MSSAIARVRGGLDERQSEFVRRVVEGESPKDAARLAGFSESSARALIQRDEIVGAIEIETARVIKSMAPIALRAIEALLVGEGIHPRIKLDAARTILEKAGHVSPRPLAATKVDRSLSEMTPDQLARVIDTLESELAARAKPVNNQAPTQQLTDILD